MHAYICANTLLHMSFYIFIYITKYITSSFLHLFMIIYTYIYDYNIQVSAASHSNTCTNTSSDTRTLLPFPSSSSSSSFSSSFSLSRSKRNKTTSIAPSSLNSATLNSLSTTHPRKQDLSIAEKKRTITAEEKLVSLGDYSYCH